MLELREKAILQTLEKIKELNIVLIGGYAINAHTQPRFSVDCDIVVKDKKETEKIKDALEKEGYKEKELDHELPYSGQFLCFIKSTDNYTIPFDILIGNVIDRKTKIKFSAEWIFENSKEMTLIGRANPIKMKLRIADPEILIVMKIASGRKSDLRDVFMLLGGDADVDFILSELKRYKLKENLKKFKDYIVKKDFKDNLQGVFGKVDEKIFNKIIKKIEEEL